MSAAGVRDAVASTRLLAAVRLRASRTPSARLAIATSVAAVCIAVLLTSNAGTLLLTLASERSGAADLSTRSGLARALLTGWVEQDFAPLATIVLAGAAAAAVLAPLTAAAPGVLVPLSQRVWLPVNSGTAYLESALVSIMSLITFAQLLALTFLASMATVDEGGRVVALLIAWSTWLMLVAASQVALWAGQAWRARGPINMNALAAALAAGTAAVVAIALTWRQARSLWGLADLYLAMLRGQVPPAVSFLGIGAVLAALVTAGWALSVRVVRAPTGERLVSTRLPAAMRGGAYLVLLQAMLRSIVRLQSVRAPILGLTGLAAGAVLIAGPSQNVIWGISLGIPLTVCLAYTRNALAVLGPANLWLGSLRTGLDHLPAVVATTGLLLTAFVASIPWVLPAAAGRLSSSDLAAVTATTIAAATLMTATSTLYAIRHPVPAQLMGGEPILAPGPTITSTLRLAVPGAFAWLVTAGPAATRGPSGDATAGWLIISTLACVALAAGITALAQAQWLSPRNRSTALVGAL